jgi:hypothetical protein
MYVYMYLVFLDTTELLIFQSNIWYVENAANADKENLPAMYSKY